VSEPTPPSPSEILSANRLSFVAFALDSASAIALAVVTGVEVLVPLILGFAAVVAALIGLGRHERGAKIALVCSILVVIILFTLNAFS